MGRNYKVGSINQLYYDFISHYSSGISVKQTVKQYFNHNRADRGSVL
jgi:hypothetical protein